MLFRLCAVFNRFPYALFLIHSPICKGPINTSKSHDFPQVVLFAPVFTFALGTVFLVPHFAVPWGPMPALERDVVAVEIFNRLLHPPSNSVNPLLNNSGYLCLLLRARCSDPMDASLHAHPSSKSLNSRIILGASLALWFCFLTFSISTWFYLVLPSESRKRHRLLQHLQLVKPNLKLRLPSPPDSSSDSADAELLSELSTTDSPSSAGLPRGCGAGCSPAIRAMCSW